MSDKKHGHWPLLIVLLFLVLLAAWGAYLFGEAKQVLAVQPLPSLTATQQRYLE